MTEGRLLNSLNHRFVIQNVRHSCTPHYFRIPQSEFGKFRAPNSGFRIASAVSWLITELSGEVGPFSLRLEILVRAPVQARFG
jgi:hypothetical protein